MQTPTPEQNQAYGECLRFDRLRFMERGAGRSGYLSAADEAAHQAADRIVNEALDAGVCFNREAFA